jgi:hypothetical protein
MTIYGTDPTRGGDGIPDLTKIEQEIEQEFKKQTAVASGDPEQAPNGTVAAQEFLNPNNPYFDNPQHSRAEAFVATLSNYEQKGDFKDLAQFVDTLGPNQLNKLVTEASNLQGPVYNDKGAAVAKNEQDVGDVLMTGLRDAALYDAQQDLENAAS